MNARAWTTPDDLVSRVRRRWADGSLLTAHDAGAPFPVVELVIRGPKASEIGDDVPAVREWVRRWDSGQRGGSRYSLERVEVGGRHFGRNSLPSRAAVTTYEQAWVLLGVQSEVRAHAAIGRLVQGVPAVAAWVRSHPHRALALDGQWPALLAAYSWLDEHRGSGRYLREISAPGVDTKLAERHRSTLADLLGVPATSSGFLIGLGLSTKPQLVRVRVSAAMGLPGPLTELALRPGELAQLDVRPTRALVVENEITYLSTPVPDGGLVLWGKGFEVDQVGRLPWLADVPVTYWGDLDTHGFAILDRLRAWLPQTRSTLMDRTTLVEYRERWGVEDRPAASRLTRLSTDELKLYDDLVGGHFGERIRLEQERIDWSWVADRLLGV